MNIGINKILVSSIGNGLKKVEKQAEVKADAPRQAYMSAPTALRSYISFKGNAPQITKATILTSTAEDITIPRTENGGYIVEPKTQTELIYGVDATKFLNKTNKFEYDTQITFPKKAKGTLYIDGKEVKIKENSTVLLNAGTDARVKVESGYPQILMSQRDPDWYIRHSGDLNQRDDLRTKFRELASLNSHTFSGQFTLDMFKCDKEKSEAIVKKLVSKNLVNELYNRNYPGLNPNKHNSRYFKFDKYPYWDYLSKDLAEKGFSKEEMDLIKPVYEQVRQTKCDTKFAFKNVNNGIDDKTLNKLKKSGILYNNKKQLDKLFWKQAYKCEDDLRDSLAIYGIFGESADNVVRVWNENNKFGYDVSGLKFINDNAAVYCLDDKVNNWNMKKSCWLTNATALSSTHTTPSIGTSIVQANQKAPTPMSAIRDGEHLHTHPGDEDRSQSEIYMVTSGSAALTVVRDGVPKVKILKEGELVVIPPKTPHCVNSVMGEYEQVVSQIPSAFQYGLAFKEMMDLPEGYTEDQMVELARKELIKAQENK